MKINRIETGGIGPLPSLSWEPGSCEVIYDDNQQGKTTLIDLLVHTVFKEGRKQLFREEGRYDNVENTSVHLEMDDEVYRFGRESSGVALSELLRWNLPELHRFLCIRASEVGLEGPRDASEIWQSLASVLGGLQEDYLEGIKRNLRVDASITKTGKWSDRQPDKFKSRILEEVVPSLDQAERAEPTLRTLIQKQHRLESKRDRVESLEEQLRDEVDPSLEQLRSQVRKRELSEAREHLEEALTLRRRIRRDYNRVDPRFEEDWQEARKQLDNAREQQDELMRNREELEEQIGNREDDLLETREELSELEEELSELEERRDTSKEAFDEARRELMEQKTPLRMATQSVEESRDDLDSARVGWSVGRWVGLLGLLVAGAGGTFLGFGELLGLATVVLGGAGILGAALLYAWVAACRNRFQSARESLRQELAGWPVEDPGEDLLEVTKRILNQDARDLLPDRASRLEELNAQLQALREKRSERNGKREQLEDQLEEDRRALQRLVERRDTVSDTIEELQEQCETYREKTGLTGFEEYLEELEERRKLEQELQSKTQRLQVLLDRDDAELEEIESVLERRQEEVAEVPDHEGSLADIRRELESLERRREEVAGECERLREEVRSLESDIHENTGILHELGVDLDHPEVLFEKERRWRRDLEDAVLERLAAQLALNRLEDLEGDYMAEVHELLSGNPSQGPALSELYSRVMDEDSSVQFDPGTFEFHVHKNGRELPEESLSTGARTHLYLCCRLVVLRRLFREGPGFMILDDPFLTYFPERKKRAIGLLESFLEAGWQILLFTVDPTSRDEFQNQLGAAVHGIGDLPVPDRDPV